MRSVGFLIKAQGIANVDIYDTIRCAVALVNLRASLLGRSKRQQSGS